MHLHLHPCLHTDGLLVGAPCRQLAACEDWIVPSEVSRGGFLLAGWGMLLCMNFVPCSVQGPLWCALYKGPGSPCVSRTPFLVAAH